MSRQAKTADSSNVKNESAANADTTSDTQAAASSTADSEASANGESENSDSAAGTAKASHDTPVTLTVSVVGDCTLGTDENFDYDTSLNAYFESYGKEYFFQNVGVDDYSGGYQIGNYLYSCGYDKAIFIAETDIDSDYSRWMGFKQAMEQDGKFCSRTRLVIVSYEKKKRLQKYSELLPRFLEVKALAFSSDYDAIEAMNFFLDQGIKIPDQISITGYDDSIYAQMVRPKLTTVHQDVSQKAHLALSRLLRMAAGEQLKEMNVKSPVHLVRRESVKEKK